MLVGSKARELTGVGLSGLAIGWSASLVEVDRGW